MPRFVQLPTSADRKRDALGHRGGDGQGARPHSLHFGNPDVDRSNGDEAETVSFIIEPFFEVSGDGGFIALECSEIVGVHTHSE
ncbi:MAG: hypothetical protein R2839_10485 [Thermomicrobiales bacterium]